MMARPRRSAADAAGRPEPAGRPARRARWAAALAVAVTALGLGACNTDDGRALRPPPPGATAPPLPSSTSSTAAAVIGPPVGSNDPSGMVLTSPAFAEGGSIPADYTCSGADVSPPLQWSGVPAATVELAIVVTDPDAGGFVHWVAAGLPAAATGIAEGGLPEGAVEARNDTSEFGWFGPCPPAGPAHRYVFTLHALTAPSGVTPGEGGPAAIAAITSTPGAAATLTGTFQILPG